MNKQVIEFYNNGQSEYVIIDLSTHYVDFVENIDNIEKPTIVRVGFYEFLFNPKYKVFEVFGLEIDEWVDDCIIFDDNECQNSENVCNANMPNIIIEYLAYLSKQTGGVEV